MAAEPTPNVFGFYSRGDCCQHEALASRADVEACLQHWDTCDRGKLLRLALRGIPNDLRPRLWRAAANLDQLRRQYQGLYRDLAQRELPAQVERDIEVDLGRTIVGHCLFDKCSEREQALSRVMRAYAAYRPAISYCQGMSFLAAVLLMYFPDEEDAFWMFVSLLERRGVRHLYDQQFAGLTALCAAATACLPKKLEAHIVPSLGLACYVTNWALTLLVASFQCWASVLMLWDLMWIVDSPAHFLVHFIVAVHKHFQGFITEEHGVSLMAFLMQRLPNEVHVLQMREMLSVKLLQSPLPKDVNLAWWTLPGAPGGVPKSPELTRKVSLQYLTNKLKENRSPRLPASPGLTKALRERLRSPLRSPNRRGASPSPSPGPATPLSDRGSAAARPPPPSYASCVLQPTSPNVRLAASPTARDTSPDGSPVLPTFTPRADKWVPSPLPSPNLKRLSSVHRRWSGSFEDADPDASPTASPTALRVMTPSRAACPGSPPARALQSLR